VPHDFIKVLRLEDTFKVFQFQSDVVTSAMRRATENIDTLKQEILPPNLSFKTVFLTNWTLRFNTAFRLEDKFKVFEFWTDLLTSAMRCATENVGLIGRSKRRVEGVRSFYARRAPRFSQSTVVFLFDHRDHHFNLRSEPPIGLSLKSGVNSNNLLKDLTKAEAHIESCSPTRSNNVAK